MNFLIKRFLLLLSLLTMNTAVQAVDTIEIQGLFSNKAVLMIDGSRHVLSVGEVSPEGVKLISANSRGAVLEIDGQQKQYDVGSTTVATTYTKRKTNKVTIYKNSTGMYMTHGSINGRSVRFLVDTGASAIAMNSEQAKQLGIRYDKTGSPASVSTASEFKDAYSVNLKTVTIGGVIEKNVEALVIEGNHPGPVLLGMTFLQRLNIEHSGSALTLIQK